MGSVAVVVRAPFLDHGSRFVQALEPVLVQALVAEAPVEALDESVLGRLAGWMKWSSTRLRYAQASSALEMNSGPLSVRSVRGRDLSQRHTKKLVASSKSGVDTKSPNQSMKLTASKPAIYALRVCHPCFLLGGSSPRARRSLSPSR